MLVVRIVTGDLKGRPAAPPGKDAGTDGEAVGADQCWLHCPV
jgi:hypothetical protein